MRANLKVTITPQDRDSIVLPATNVEIVGEVATIYVDVPDPVPTVGGNTICVLVGDGEDAANIRVEADY